MASHNKETKCIFIRLYDKVTDEKIIVYDLEILQSKFDDFVINHQGLLDHELFVSEVSAYKRENNKLIEYVREKDTGLSNNVFGQLEASLNPNDYISGKAILLKPSSASKDEIYERYDGDFTKPYNLVKGGQSELLLTHYSFKPKRIYTFKINGPLYNSFLLASHRYEELGERASLDEIEQLFKLGRHCKFTLHKGLRAFDLYYDEAKLLQPKSVELMKKINSIL